MQGEGEITDSRRPREEKDNAEALGMQRVRREEFTQRAQRPERRGHEEEEPRRAA
jgi:hypothetical protein